MHGAGIGRADLGQACQQLIGGEGHVLEFATTDISKVIEDAAVLAGDGVIQLRALTAGLTSRGYSEPWSLETFNHTYWNEDPQGGRPPRTGSDNRNSGVKAKGRLRLAAAATIAGIASGLVAGVLARIAMRLVAVSRGDVPGFSITGTVGILMVFLVMACTLALLFAILVARRSARPRPGWWSLAGVALFACVVLLTPLRQELGGRPEFLALFVPVGLLLGWSSAWLTLTISRSLPEPGGAARPLYGVLAAAAVLATLALPLLLVFGILQSVGVIPLQNQ